MFPVWFPVPGSRFQVPGSGSQSGPGNQKIHRVRKQQKIDIWAPPAPAVISGWLLAFTLSLDDLVIASFTSGPSATTLPIKIFSAVRLGVSPEINALSTIMIAMVTIGVISASLISKRAAVRQRLEEQQAVRS